MITAPALEYSIDVSTPEFNAGTLKKEENKVISLDAKGIIYLDNVSLSLGFLEQNLLKSYQDSNMNFFVRADESRPYGEVMAIMRVVKSAGIENVSLITRKEK